MTPIAFDLLMAGGQVVDGTGAAPVRADVGVRGDRIAEVGDLSSARAERTIDARGRVIAPGFIDIHSHADETVLADPRAESALRQGVTTLVCGNCGSSSAPAVGLAAEEVDRRAARLGVERTWTSFDEYLAAIERQGVAVNVCSFVGHGRLRQCVMGGERRAPSGGELAAMKALLASCLDEGAVGMASGLIYPPSSYGSTDELAALSEVVAARGGLYASHIRHEGATLFEAVEEGLAIGRRSGARVQLSHHKAAGRANWGKVTTSLAMIAAAREDSVDVAADQYPYAASSTGLAVVVPDWAHEGGTAALVARLRDPATRARLESGEREVPWEGIVIVRARATPGAVGRTVAQVAQERGRDPFQTACDLLVENDGLVQTVRHSMCEEDVQTVLRAPFVCVGSDSSAIAPRGALGEGRPHPRTYGTFPRILGRYVRELGVLPLEEAVRKMTSLTASRLRLVDRGVLRAGAYADLVVFDPIAVADTATFDDPHRFPAGLDHVVVNGGLQLEDGAVAGSLHGRVLRLGRDAR